ncbi:MAG: hypothetical protein WBP08_15325 [Saprospiraceae bacterium]|jgi:hypothetical protein|nr:hypothetical protein [Saprospiraceae bacterium]
MALSFHYKGKLKNAPSLPFLVEELEDICHVFDWKIKVYNNIFPKNTFADPVNDENYGIMFTPPSSDPVSFVFDSEGRVIQPWLRDILKKTQDGEIKVITIQLNVDDASSDPIVSEQNEAFDPASILYSVHVKMPSSSAEIYVKVVELLRYLSQKYLEDFTIKDETNYWGSGDVTILKDDSTAINVIVERFQELLGREPIKDPKDFIRLLKKLNREIKRESDKPDKKSEE